VLCITVSSIFFTGVVKKVRDVIIVSFFSSPILQFRTSPSWIRIGSVGSDAKRSSLNNCFLLITGNNYWDTIRKGTY
jgi:hypothetical protein